MVELNKKYKIGVRRFSFINWIGFYPLYKKETLRFLIVSGQTILGPVVTAILFLMVISLALGENRGVVLGVPFVEFLAPGLISMQIIQQSFAHSSSSILSGKMMGNIVDLVGKRTINEVCNMKNLLMRFYRKSKNYPHWDVQ